MKNAGTPAIRIIMVTGDFGVTAWAVAAQIGMGLDERFPVITGEAVSRMPEKELRRLLKRKGDMVFARTSPEEKLRIVMALRNLGQVVAVTGDGVNDAPALKAADIGVAMGKRGTEVSKEAATMVLADDNFASIVAAIEEGRAVYANIKKFITYIFNSNVPEAVPFILFVLFGIPLPLNIMQILAVDLGTDILPGLALGAEPPEPGIMASPAPSPRDRLIDLGRGPPVRLFGLLSTGAALLPLFFCLSSLPAGGRDWRWRPAAPFTTGPPPCATAGSSLRPDRQRLAMRTDRESLFRVGLFTNRLLWGIGSEVVILLALSYVPFLQRTLSAPPPSGAPTGCFCSSSRRFRSWPMKLRKAWGRRRRPTFGGRQLNSGNGRPGREKNPPVRRGMLRIGGVAATALLPGELFDLLFGVLHFLDLFGVEAQQHGLEFPHVGFFLPGDIQQDLFEVAVISEGRHLLIEVDGVQLGDDSRPEDFLVEMRFGDFGKIRRQL